MKNSTGQEVGKVLNDKTTKNLNTLIDKIFLTSNLNLLRPL